MISEIVTDTNSESLNGTSVFVKGTIIRTTTKMDSLFNLPSNIGDVIVFSYIS